MKRKIVATLTAGLLAASAVPAIASDKALVREVKRDLRDIRVVASSWSACLEYAEFAEDCDLESLNLLYAFREAETNVVLGWATVGRRTFCGARVYRASVRFNRTGVKMMRQFSLGNLDRAYTLATTLDRQEVVLRQALSKMRQCRVVA